MADSVTLITNQWLFAAVVVTVLLGLAELGYRIGLRIHAARDVTRREQFGGVQGAVLGLLGLLLGFTFSMALHRYETRREMVLKEANAIGTAYLRAGLLPEAHQEPARELFRRFVDVRVRTQAVSDDPSALAAGLRECAAIETELWRHAEAAGKEAPTAMTATFINALNEMIDTDAERVTAGRNRIPNGVWFLLLLVAASGCFISACESGAKGSRSPFTGLLLPLLICVVIVLIFDLMHTHQGAVSVSQQPMLDLQQSLRAATGK